MTTSLKIAIFSFICQLPTINVLHANESEFSQVEMISKAQFVAVVVVDKNNQLKIEKIVKGDPARAAELSKSFEKKNYQIGKNTRYLYLVTKPKEIHGANFSVSHFIQVYYKDQIFIKNRLVFWPDLFSVKKQDKLRQ